MPTDSGNKNNLLSPTVPKIQKGTPERAGCHTNGLSALWLHEEWELNPHLARVSSTGSFHTHGTGREFQTRLLSLRTGQTILSSALPYGCNKAMYPSGSSAKLPTCPMRCCGFLTMRDPMRFTQLQRLSPSFVQSYSYYQRLVLDKGQRIQLRILGALVSLFGFTVFTASLGGILHSHVLGSVSDGLLALMGLLFCCAWLGGLVYIIVQWIRVESPLKWWRLWRTAAELGPVDVFPPVTPVMQQEKRMFTTAFCALVSVVIVAALVRG
jgi:hypothetical protein